MTTLTAQSPTLYELEGDLLALLDTADLVDSEQKQEFDQDLTGAITATVEKRDRCGAFLAHCASQMEACNTEIKRLRARSQQFEKAAERMRGYLSFVIESIGRDAKGKYKKLEGNLFSFSLRNNPPSVAITDVDRIPVQYKQVSITLSVADWNDIIHACKCSPFEDAHMALELELQVSERTINKRAIKDHLEEGLDVPGADLKIGDTSLVVR
jgi:hypothetical protein